MGRWSAVRAMLAVLSLSAMAARCGDSPASPTPPPPPPPPPVTLTITCPAAQSGVSLQNQPVTVTWASPVTTGGTAPVQTTCAPGSGSGFSAGVSTVTCTATDAGTQRASCTFAVTISRPPQISVTRFMAFGDSITWGREVEAAPASLFEIPAPEFAYPNQLAASLTARYIEQSITMVNDGWPGEMSATGRARLPGDLALYTPQVLLLLHGANDLLNFPSEATAADIASQLRAMVQTARKAGLPANRILLATFPPQYHPATPPPPPNRDRSAGADFVPGLNQRIVEVARIEGVTLVDFYTPMLPDVKQNIGWDGLHPTIKGFTLMADIMNQAIRQVFETKAAGTAPAVNWR